MSGTLPSWLHRLLGIDTGPGEGTVWSIDHAWHWPPWLTLLLVVFAAVLVVSVYLREGHQASQPYKMLLAAVRLALVAIVLVMIAQVALSLKRTGLPYVAVLVDDSLSMTIVDRYEDRLRRSIEERIAQAGLSEGLSRWNLARTLLLDHDAAMLAGIAQSYKLRLYYLTGLHTDSTGDAEELAQGLRSALPTGDSTRLGAAVRGILDDLRGAAPSAIVLLTDGINTDGPSLAEAAAYARRKGVPLFTVALGSDQPVRDLKLADVLVDPVVFVDDLVPVEAKMSGSGFEGRKVNVVLRQQGPPQGDAKQPPKPQIVARTEVTIGPDGQSQTVRLSFRPDKEGQFQYVVEVEPQKEEVQTDNNRQQRQVEVRKEKIRVLLAQAYPNYEFRYLRNMLARNKKTIELHTVLQEADVESVEQDATALRVFPVRRDELFSYDVIILGDVNPALLSASVVQNLADFVDQPGKGGALVLLAGPRYMPLAFRDTPLARLLPVELRSLQYPDPDKPLAEGFVVQPTDLGLGSPPLQLGDTPEENHTIWKRLAPLYWFVEAPDLKPAARVLAEHPTRTAPDGRRLPLVVMQYVGAGKVLFHATDETWRWRARVGDVFFARYWLQMIRYLSRSKLAGAGASATLSTDRREYTQGEPVRLRVRFTDERLAPAEDDGVKVAVQQHGQRREVQLQRSGDRGTFEGVMSRLPVGAYHALVTRPTMAGTAPAIDFVVLAPPGEFERIQTDTAALQQAAKETEGRWYTFATADRLLDDLPAGRQVPIESLPPKPLWNTWPVLLAFLALLIGEWVLRKMGGMV